MMAGSAAGGACVTCPSPFSRHNVFGGPRPCCGPVAASLPAQHDVRAVRPVLHHRPPEDRHEQRAADQGAGRLEAEEVSANERPLIPDHLPVLPLRDTVLFPNSFMPLAVAREASVRLIDESMTGSRLIAVFTQRDASVEEPSEDDLFRIGTATHIHKMFKLPDGSLRLIVQGLVAGAPQAARGLKPYLMAEVEEAEEIERDDDLLEIDALQRNIKTNFQQVVSLSPLLSDDLQTLALNIAEPGKLADFIVSSLPTITTAVKQEVLETLDVRARMDLLNRMLIKELEVLELGSKIQSQVQSEVGKNQREYFLREQLKAIQKRARRRRRPDQGDRRAAEEDSGGRHARHVLKEASRELDRLSKMPVAAAEYTVSRTYLDWLVSLPWAPAHRRDDRPQADQGDPRRRSLGPREGQGPHPRVPRRAQAEPRGEGADPLLRRPAGRRQDLAGALDRHAIGRKFVRVSLGGMRDEAEIRGHRRTYIGALPGQIVQGLRRAESRNPVFMLDEIDKLGADFRGDPASALLEVLDPEQNTGFRDHYLDVPFDLSEVFFITTANVLDPVPPALRDRMEVLELPGYTEEEKLEIAREHLIAKQVKNHGLTPEQLTFTDEAVHAVIRSYTREAGVRNLERELGALCRKVARRRAEGNDERGRDHAGQVADAARRAQVPGRGDRGADGASRASPSAWPGRRRAARCCSSRPRGCRARHADADRPARRRDEGVGARRAVVAAPARDGYGIDPEFFKGAEIHVHVPSGAIPKDGPSAGVTMVTALVSELTGVRCAATWR